MKAVMYHYVRPDDSALPHFRHLTVQQFRKQLDYFATKYRFLEVAELKRAVRDGTSVQDGVLLTFDDGFRDHYEHVFPELKARRIPGFFYVSTSPYRTGKMLDVHRIHMLIGAFGGGAVWEALQAKVSGEMLSHGHVRAFREATYRTQSNDEATKNLKRTLNYYIDHRHRERLLNELAAEFFGAEEELSSALYLTVEQMAEMRDAGMVIGSHADNHFCMSKLGAEEQRQEIRDSFAMLEEMLGQSVLKSFCHPYGGSHSFNGVTERLLEEEGCILSFNVEPRDIESRDLRERRQALPRYDCALFPHGSRAIAETQLSSKT